MRTFIQRSDSHGRWSSHDPHPDETLIEHDMIIFTSPDHVADVRKIPGVMHALGRTVPHLLTVGALTVPLAWWHRHGLPDDVQMALITFLPSTLLAMGPVG